MSAEPTDKAEYADWDDLRAEITERVGIDRVEAARQDLHAWLRAYNLAEAGRRLRR
jgi:hypothetical protein